MKREAVFQLDNRFLVRYSNNKLRFDSAALMYRHHNRYNIYTRLYAGMAELADAQDSGSCNRKVVQVQVLLPAPESTNTNPKPIKGSDN